MKDIRIFDPKRPINACIVNVENFKPDQIRKLLDTQRALGRTEFEYLASGERKGETCGDKPPKHTSSDPAVFCNREKGHGGEHCRQLLNITGYHNIWWP